MMRTPDDSGGKRGRCPHCNETTQIPSKSTAGLNQPFVENPVLQSHAEAHTQPTAQPSPPYSPPNPYIAANSGGKTPHKATISLVLGIISIVTPALAVVTCCCWPVSAILLVVSIGCGIPAIVLGYLDLKGMKAGLIDDVGRGLAQTGLILGSTGSALSAIGLVTFLVFLVISIINS